MRDHYKLARLYLDAPLSSVGDTIELSTEQSHYLSSVLRLKTGDLIRVFNAASGEWQARLTVIGKKTGSITLTETLRPPTPAPDIWLVFAPLKRHRTSFILEKATELGVGKFMPVLTARTQNGKLRLDKMTAQITEAAEQTERLDLPELEPPQTLEALLSAWPKGRTLIFADEGGDAAPALPALQKLSSPAALLIGPEGGFTEGERAVLRSHDFVRPVSLGPRILRADTAALSLLTLWQATNGDWQ